MYNNDLTNILKQIIINRNLIDTGNLLNNISVELYINNNFIINIKTTDYFIYLFERYYILDEMVASEVFKTTLELEIKKMLEEQLLNIISSNISITNINFDFSKIIILINGN